VIIIAAIIIVANTIYMYCYYCHFFFHNFYNLFNYLIINYFKFIKIMANYYFLDSDSDFIIIFTIIIYISLHFLQNFILINLYSDLDLFWLTRQIFFFKLNHINLNKNFYCYYYLFK